MVRTTPTLLHTRQNTSGAPRLFAVLGGRARLSTPTSVTAPPAASEPAPTSAATRGRGAVLAEGWRRRQAVGARPLVATTPMLVLLLGWPLALAWQKLLLLAHGRGEERLALLRLLGLNQNPLDVLCTQKKRPTEEDVTDNSHGSGGWVGDTELLAYEPGPLRGPGETLSSIV